MWPAREMYATKMTFTNVTMTFRVPRDTIGNVLYFSSFLFLSFLSTRVNRDGSFHSKINCTQRLRAVSFHRTITLSIIDPINFLVQVNQRITSRRKSALRGTVALCRIVKLRRGHVDKAESPSPSPGLRGSLIKHKRVKLVLLPPPFPLYVKQLFATLLWPVPVCALVATPYFMRRGAR